MDGYIRLMNSRCVSNRTSTPHYFQDCGPSVDRPRSSNSTTEAMDESGSTSLSPGYELSPPHLIPKAKNFASQRLEFSGKPILNNSKYLPKQRLRRFWKINIDEIVFRIISEKGRKMLWFIDFGGFTC
ncbi:hypothetical protein ACTXT7_010404 [Hymenolepis weldensis]